MTPEALDALAAAVAHNVREAAALSDGIIAALNQQISELEAENSELRACLQRAAEWLL